jgi:hypothetical protein
MTESELYAGIATTLLDKFAGRIIKGLTDPVKKAWEQFKIDFDIVFRDYLKNSVEKYGKIKTDEPRTLDFSGVRGFLVTNVCIVQRSAA